MPLVVASTEVGLPPFFTSAIACSHETGFVGEHEGHLFSDCVALSGVLADRFVSRKACWQRGKHVDNLLGQAPGIKRKGFEALVFRMQQGLEAPSWVLEKLVARTNQIYAIRLQAHAWSIFM